MLIHLQYIYCRSALSYSLSSSSTGRARKHRIINQLFPQFLDMQQTIEEWEISTRDLFLGTTVSWRVIQRTFTHPSHHPDDHSTKSTNLWSCVNSPRSSLLLFTAHRLLADLAETSAGGGAWPSVFNVGQKASIYANATCGLNGREEYCKMVDAHPHRWVGLCSPLGGFNSDPLLLP